jgi:single-strand DNA-binding protein
MYLNRITLIGFIGSDTEEKVSNATNIAIFSLAPRRPGRMTPEPGNLAPSGIDVSPPGNWPILPPFAKGAHVAIEGELRTHEYQRELAVGTQQTTIPRRVWEIRVGSVLKLDRAVKRESADENHKEVPR